MMYPTSTAKRPQVDTKQENESNRLGAFVLSSQQEKIEMK